MCCAHLPLETELVAEQIASSKDLAAAVLRACCNIESCGLNALTLHRLGQAGDAEGALALLQTMKAGGVQPDIITKFTLVEALMEGWMRQGRPAALLAQAEALNLELHAASDSLLNASPSR